MDTMTYTLEKETVLPEIQFFNPPMPEAFTYTLADLRPNIDHLITEDDTPVDNLPSEKQQRLLTEPLYSSQEQLNIKWPFLAAANVGLFYGIHQPVIVPDMFLSLEVEVADDWWEKEYRSYFMWEFGKMPEVAIEIVSNKVGGEASTKIKRYARMGISYYVIFDPQKLLSEQVLRIYELDFRTHDYQLMTQRWLPLVGLGLTLWEGEFEGKHDVWLRWCDESRQVIPTGRELAHWERAQKELALERVEEEWQRAEQEWQRAEQERQRAEQERQRAEQERQEKEVALQRAEMLMAKLKELGILDF